MSRTRDLRRRSRHRLASFAVAAALAASAGIALAGCSAPVDTPPPSTVAPSPSFDTATPTPTATAAPVPALIPEGSAEDNLPFFASIVAAVWASPGSVSGRAYIDALVAAGFDKSTMQVTSDTSTVGNPAESIQFSTVWAGECLVGQVGPATGQPVSTVLPALADGTCLLGQTRPIDW